MEIHDAIGSFVAHYAGQDRASQDRASQDRACGTGDGTREQAGAARDRTAQGATGLVEEAGITAGMPEIDPGLILRGHHVRAGRALLDWTMSDLADSSGLSLSTVRRLEQDAEGVLTRNRRSAVQALRHAGVCFLPLSNGAVAVAKLTDAVPVP
ncbi:hypothetical protein CS379_24870 [Methylobacterium frigidaeris]|uniref:hypothetical protein n=1 Tax=Methylobacterium frigidaeris TaxID=2038277 RepID=UPI000C1A13BA|nr:hypothetical protein [Methylobacterium frigidaeris]PIK70397.1 hypothetical protein CS379_24870 [Methylobacterium frigidaeris]